MRQKTNLFGNFKPSNHNIIELKKTEVSDLNNQNLKGSNKNLGKLGSPNKNLEEIETDPFSPIKLEFLPIHSSIPTTIKEQDDILRKQL